MRVQAPALFSWIFASTTHAFVISRKIFLRQKCLKASNQFEYLLNENGADFVPFRPRSRRVVTQSEQNVQLMSSAAVSVDTHDDIEQEYAMSEADEDDIVSQSNIGEFEGDSKLLSFQESQGTNKFTKWISQADFQEIVWTLFVPSLLAFAGLKWGLGKVQANLSGKAESMLESFANEMIYHDGNNDELKLCKLDWDGRLTWLGPSKKKRMLSVYLEDYTKRKPVSPQAISSISYVFSLFGLSEEQAAETMVAVARRGGAEKISSANKLLFLGTRILVSQEALAKLQDIKDLIKSTYRSGAGADAIVDTSQYAIGEAAYRSLVQKSGKSDKIPDGWKVLGLKLEAAIEIYNEEKDAGFKTAQEEIYGGINEKYNKKGQRIDERGFVIEEKDIEANEKAKEWGDDDEMTSTSGAFECGNCGYTLFVAKGREAKFFGVGFKCPQCGADKDKFKTVEDIE